MIRHSFGRETLLKGLESDVNSLNPKGQAKLESEGLLKKGKQSWRVKGYSNPKRVVGAPVSELMWVPQRKLSRKKRIDKMFNF